MIEEDKGTMSTIFETHCHLVKPGGGLLDISTELENKYREFVRQFASFSSLKRDLLEKIYGLFDLNFSMTKALSSLQAVNPSSWVSTENLRNLDKRLSFGLCTLFQRDLHSLDELANSLFGETIFQHSTPERQNLSPDLSNFLSLGPASSIGSTSIQFGQGSLSVLSPEFASLDKSKKQEGDLELAVKFSTNYLKGLSMKSFAESCVTKENFEESFHHLKLKIVNEEEEILITMKAVKQYMKRYFRRNNKLVRRLAFYFYFSPVNISILLAANSMLQAYSHSHFLLTGMSDSLLTRDLMEFAVNLNHGVFHNMFPVQGSQRFRESLWTLLEEIVTDLWHKKITHYLYVDLNNFEDEMDRKNVVQDLNSLIQNETISCILPFEAMERIINDWKRGEAYKNLGVYEVLIAMKPLIQNHIRIILIPHSEGGVENLKENFSSLMNKIFFMNLFSRTAIDFEETNKLQSIFCSVFQEEMQIEKLWDPKLDIILEESRKMVESSSLEIEKLLCFELMNNLVEEIKNPVKLYLGEAFSVEDEKLSDLVIKLKEIELNQPDILTRKEILFAISFYTVYAAKHPYQQKGIILNKIKECLDLKLQSPLGNYLKGMGDIIKEANALDSSIKFYSDEIMNDIFSIQALAKYTQIPILAIWDPQELLPLNLGDLSGIGEDSIIEIENLDSLHYEELKEKNGIVFVKNYSGSNFGSICESFMEDYYDGILKNMMRINTDEGDLKQQQNVGLRLIFVFTKRQELIGSKEIIWVNLGISEADEEIYRKSLTNLLVYNSHPNIEQELLSSEIYCGLENLTSRLKQGMVEDDNLNSLNIEIAHKENTHFFEEDKIYRDIEWVRNLKGELKGFIGGIFLIRKALGAVLKLKDAEIKFPEKAFLNILIKRLELVKEKFESEDDEDSTLLTTIVSKQDYKNEVISQVIQDVSNWMDEKLQKTFHTYFTILVQTQENSKNIELWKIFKTENSLVEREYIFENITICQEWEKTSQLLCSNNLLNTNRLEPVKYSPNPTYRKNESTPIDVNENLIKLTEGVRGGYENSFDEKHEDEESSGSDMSEEIKEDLDKGILKVPEVKTPKSSTPEARIDLQLQKTRSAGPTDHLMSQTILRFKKVTPENAAGPGKDRKSVILPLRQRISSSDKVYLWTPQSPAFKEHSPSGSPFAKQMSTFNNAFDEFELQSKASHKNDSSSQSSLGRGFYRQSSYNIEVVESQDETVMKKYYSDLNYLKLFKRPKQNLLENRRKIASKFEPFRTVELAIPPQSDLEEIELDRYYQEIILSLLCEFKPQNQEILNLARRHPNEMIELLLLENNVEIFNFIFSKLDNSPLLFMMLLKMTKSGLLFSLSDNLTANFVHKQLAVLETLEEALSVEKNKKALVLFYETEYSNLLSLIKAFASNQQLEVVKISFLKFKETEIETRIKTSLEENRWVIVEGVCPYSEKRMERIFTVLEDLDRSFLINKGKLIMLVHNSYHSSFYSRSFKCLNMIYLTSCSSIKEMLTSFYMNQFIECCVKATVKRRTLVKSTSAAQMIGTATKKVQLKQFLPLVKFLGHLGKNASKDYTSWSLNKRPAPTSPQPDRVHMDKYSFSLNFILSAYYKRQIIGETAKTLPKIELLHHEIFAISELASKIFSEYEIDPNVIIAKLIPRFLGLDLKEKADSLNSEGNVIQSLIQELIDNEGSRPVLLDVIGNKYEFYSPVETLTDNQKSLMVTSVIGRYPQKDPFEILGMTFGAKLAYNFELTQELYQNLILLENKSRRNSVEKSRILSFVQDIYDSICNSLEEINVPESLEERNVKMSPELLALASSSKQVGPGRGRPSLFQQRSKGDLTLKEAVSFNSKTFSYISIKPDPL